MTDYKFLDNDHFSGISVIIITYNEEKNIKDCLNSLLELDYPKDRCEVIVVDSSTDSTPEIVSGYKNVRLIRSRKGFSQQRNMGWKQAVYNITAFVDADTIVPSEYLKIINKAFKNIETAAIGGNAYPPENTNRFGVWAACVGHPAGGAMGFKANMKKGQKKPHFLPGCNSAFRKNSLEAVSGFDPEFYDGGEDVDISRRMRERGFSLEYIPELTVYHKPRNSLKKYIQWNMGVGRTKFNLTHPSLFKLIFQPSFPLWSLLPVALIFLLLNHPFVLAVLAVLGWILFLMTLCLFANPYPHLLKQRKKIGISFLSVFFIVPVLIYLRQVSINIGQLKKWRSHRYFFMNRSG
ncbi:MAG: glycosyltransferase [Candidatus Aminicenantes bacterium]|nr:glycosyltransferase [Candidatus Aminicenantes bacterium]